MVLTGQPYFQIDGFGRGEAQVAAAQHHGTIWKLQLLQHGFGVTGQAVQCVPRRFWMDQLYQLNFFELMLANHSSGIPPIAARIAAKTRRVTNMANWQVCLV